VEIVKRELKWNNQLEKYKCLDKKITCYKIKRKNLYRLIFYNF